MKPNSYANQDKWYWSRYLTHRDRTKTHKEAWKKAEIDHFKRFTRWKYRSFSTFKSAEERLYKFGYDMFFKIWN